MNAFVDLIRRTRLNVTVYHNAMVCGDWQLSEYHLGVCCFHMVTIGSCHMSVMDQMIVLNQGDLVFFPREIAHKIYPINASKGDQQHLAYSRKDDHEGTGLLCGAIYFDHPSASQLLDSLPVYCVIPANSSQAWFTPLYELILAECYAPTLASSVILDRLSELIFFQCLQYVLQTSQQHNLLSLYAHSQLVQVVNAIHKQPQYPWGLESLARQANVSRTKFAKLFRDTSGWTPMQYITWWRMQIAVDLLRDGESFGQICESIGYQSEAAFQRSFKQIMGVSPGKFRHNAGTSRQVK